MLRVLLLSMLAVLLTLPVACDDGDDGGDGDADADTDTDTDVDTDADTDADTDSDTDTDPCAGATTVEDYDGNEYATVAVGPQCWMAEDLRVTAMPDGTPIDLVDNATAWGEMADNSIAYCYYDDDPSNAADYGALYTWTAAMNGAEASDATPSGVQGVCPDGWHLPSDGDFVTLNNYCMNGEGGQVGGRLKETGTDHWNDPNVGATNQCGFTGRGSGRRHWEGNFVLQLDQVFYWTTSTTGLETQKLSRTLQAADEALSNNGAMHNNGHTVRCVRD